MDLKDEAISADRTHKHELLARDELLIDVINHLRHDWMNDIQVLYGYLRLNKHDKLMAFMETIKQKAARESMISKLGVTELIVYLYSFRVQCPQIELEVELEQDFQLKELPVEAEQVAELVIAILDCFKTLTYESDCGETYHLQLEWNVEEAALTLRFDFRGESDQDTLQRQIAARVAAVNEHMLVQMETEFESQWATLTIRVPFISK
ncbi:MAG: hypothetical protein K0R67_2470 [Paenibacillus sp.]|jgi:hypothetical protein|nr:hypothetical protein [Paenibacillus sp.]